MAVKKLSDLLPISDNNTNPNAYQVFGLTVGESNSEVIERSIESMIAKVKSAKPETDPALWKQIAGIVQAARLTLIDQDKKSRLDARIKPASSSASKPVDPLAALLPPVNPMQPVAGQKSTSTDAASPNPPKTPSSMPPGLFSTPVADVPAAKSPAGDRAPIKKKTEAATAKVNVPDVPPEVPIAPFSIPEPNVPEPPTPEHQVPGRQVPEQQVPERPIVSDASERSTRRPRRRRKSVFVPVIMSLITLGLMAVVGLLAYALFFRQETIAISSSDGSVNITTGRNNSKPSPTQPAVQPQAQIPVVESEPVQSEPANMESPPSFPSMSMEPAIEPPMDMPMNTAEQTPQEMIEETSAAEMQAVPTSPPNPNADAELAELTSAIRQGDWSAMSKLTESIYQMKLSSEQQADADGLLSVAELAVYYRRGIERAIAELNAGDDFEVKNGFRVVVVSKTNQSLAVRYNANIREYTFDELPLSLAHRLATFQIPEGPSGEAAKAVYQMVAPKSNAGYRTQAIGWLGDIEQPIEGADRDQLVQTLQAIYGEN
ncbi:hypothetical protein LF1_42120 [Rubripirellula obstinata]|uniref:Uncharacterized protein n=2 Tax=Rubripirellula obstinata TaxID=406547 RepID=A0A5B1CKC0_9BACT|nr:hypothetical protein LF1_42120 [Rubripirellula obstinata]